MREADIHLLKLAVNYFFSNERQTTPIIEQQLDTVFTSPDFLGFLVRKNFIGYLNYLLLKKMQEMIENDSLKQQIEIYEREHDDFFYSVNFNTIIEVFNECPKLAPVSHIGLPEFKIYLETPWNDKNIYEWTEFFEFRFEWPPSLFITEVSKNCILITYAVLPRFVLSVVGDLTNPDVLREFEENGVKVELSKELIEMNSKISKNSRKELEKYITFSKQPSSSLHVKGMRSLKVKINLFTIRTDKTVMLSYYSA